MCIEMNDELIEKGAVAEFVEPGSIQYPLLGSSILFSF